ncbi:MULTISPECIES: alpha/beta fold hydrolase [unclassified Streptomyces]|uniref:thioesterase II family protein n=1 Tax=unclassified Streptomyces TaxID=2593676 RepID=UPI0034503FBF
MTVISRGTAGKWFRRYPARSGAPRLRLVCLPHAGGTATLFHGWAGLLPDAVEVLATQYPGRQERFREPCASSMTELADAITDALEPELDVPVAFFGHSLGSAVAYEVARRIDDRHGVVPVRVVVSGRGAPHTERAGGTLHLLDDERLVAAARRLGDVGSAVYDDPDLRPLLLPSLRADFRIIETYRPLDATPLRAPVTAVGGTADPGCTLPELLSWSALTTDSYEHRLFPGDHFYLVPQEEALVRFLAERL